MITAEDVFDFFMTFVSPDTSVGTEKILSLCASSLEKIKRLISEDADKSDTRIAYAGACDAYYLYALGELSDFEENADFKAGDVTVRKKLAENLKIAEGIRKAGLETLMPLTEQSRFGAWCV